VGSPTERKVILNEAQDLKHGKIYKIQSVTRHDLRKTATLLIMSDSPVGIVTGGASGIGLAVTKHLLSRGYRIMIADMNAEQGEKIASELGSSCSFHKTDVSKYSEQAALFSAAFKWGGDRLDLAHLNAGIDDKQSLYQTDEELDENGLPKPLNLKTLDVDLYAVFQGVWLFKHFARKNKTPGGKIIVTSSAAGI